MKTNLILPAILCVTIFSCKKQGANDDEKGNCDNIARATITSNSPVTIGETIKFGTDEVGGYRIYDWRGPDYYTGQEPSDSITDANLEHEGWYRLHLYSLDDNCDKFDSVYIDVKLKQGIPACSIANNTCTFNNLGDDSYTTVHKRIESTYSLKSLEGSGPGSNIIIYFHPFWVNAEPEDGIYTTTNVPSFGQTDNNYNKVFVTTTKSSIYWASHEDQDVYVSHVNGKLQVRFCNLSMGGYNGTSYTTIASGNVVEL